MEEMLKRAREVASEAAVAAGTLARERFDSSFVVQEKGADGDLVTEVDQLAEAEILRRLQAAFPEHLIRSEETGLSGVEGEWMWMVDPLDGTNNFAIGLPVYGVCITLLHRGRWVLGVVYDSPQDKLYVAEKGRGVTCNGEAVRMPERKALPGRFTIGWIQGHLVQKEAGAMKLRDHLEKRCKRTMRLWAPTIMWALVARGTVDGIVLYNSEGEDLYAGVLMVQEAGGVVVDYDGKPFEEVTEEPYLIACHPDHLEAFLAMVREGLS